MFLVPPRNSAIYGKSCILRDRCRDESLFNGIGFLAYIAVAGLC